MIEKTTLANFDIRTLFSDSLVPSDFSARDIARAVYARTSLFNRNQQQACATKKDQSAVEWSHLERQT